MLLYKTSCLVILLKLVSGSRSECPFDLPKVRNEYSLVEKTIGCPRNVSYVSNVESDRIQGAWYAQFLPDDGSSIGCDGCWTFYTVKTSDNRYSFVFCCQKNGKPWCNDALGGGTVIDSVCEPSKYVQIEKGQLLFSYNLAVDYDKFFIGYSCNRQPNGQAKPKVFVFTRTPTVCMCSFKPLVVQILKENGIDPSILVPVKQGRECRYTFGCQYCSCAGLPY